jgi:hypothetical protein
MSDDGIKKAKARVVRMDDFVMDELFSLSDEELLREANEEGVDVAAVGAAGRQAFEQAQLTIGKARMERIRKEMALDAKKVVVSLETKTARSEIQTILSRNRDAASKLTMAARSQSGNVQDDIDGILEDFVELGAIKGQKTEEDPG